MTAYPLLYSIRVPDVPVEPRDLPEFYNPAKKLFVLALVANEKGEDHYVFSALDGEAKANASTEAVADAWMALTTMLEERLNPNDPLKEVLVSAEMLYWRATTPPEKA